MICKFSTVEEVKDYFENIIAVMPLHVYWKDIHGVILGCNNQQALSAGMTREQMIGKTDYQMPWKAQADEIRRSDNHVIQRGEKLVVEEKSTLVDGKQFIFLSTKLPLYDPKKHSIVGVIGISVDITDRKNMESDLKSAKRKAEEFNQLKSQFISNMQHDLRSPTSGVMQALSYLSGVEKDPEKLEVLNMALGSSEALMSLLNEIVDCSNTNYCHPVMDEPLELKDVFDAVHRLHAASAAMKHLQFHYHLDEHIPRVIISDHYRLERILLNLVANAIKFTDKGEVSFEAKCVKQEGRELLIELTVKDTGIGIPQDKKNIIFERFVRLDASNRGVYKGIGLGLTNVREYVHDLAGEFKPIISAKGTGTIFSILIPMKVSLDQGMQLLSVEKRKTAKPIPIGGKKPLPAKPRQTKSTAKEVAPLDKTKPFCRILLVEDSLPAQFMTKALIKGIGGCQLEIAGTAEAALEMIGQKPYDLIFADIGLPGMDGIEMTRHIRYEERKKGGRRIPIVGQSANADTQNRKACIEAGMQDLLAKPLTGQGVKDVLHNYVMPEEALEVETPFKAPSLQNEQVVDYVMLKKIWRRANDLKETFISTKEHTLQDIKDYQKAYQTKNWDQFRFLTHRIRGCFLYFAAPRAEEAFGYLEDYLKNHKTLDEKIIHALYHLVQPELDKVLKEVDSICESVKDAW